MSLVRSGLLPRTSRKRSNTMIVSFTRVADDREQSGDDFEADLEAVDLQRLGEAGNQVHEIGAERDHADGDEHVVQQCEHGGQAERNLLEPQPEVNDDADATEHDGI